MTHQEEDNQQQSAGEDTGSRKDAPGGADNDTSKIYLTDNSTLQTPEEYELDKHGDHHKDEDGQVTATDVQDSEPGIDDNTLAGSDLPGVSET